MLEVKFSGIKRMEILAQETPGSLSLSQGALRVGGVPHEIKNYLKTLLNSDITDYYVSSYGITPLRQKLAEVLSVKHNTSISMDQILISHGSSSAIASLMLTLLNADDEVLIPEPTYPAYINLTRIAKGKPVLVPCFGNEGNGKVKWEFDIEKLKAAITPKTKMLIFSNPGNPTGVIVEEKYIKELAELCESRGIYLVVDEVYDDFIFYNEPFHSITPYVSQSNYIIRAGSFSKNFALSGWRIGYIVLPKSLLHPMCAVQDGLLISASSLAQYAALYALNNPQLVAPMKEMVFNNLIYTNAVLKPLVDRGVFDYEEPKSAFYVFLKTKEKETTDLCLDILKKVKVTVVPGSVFGPAGDSYIRICYARETAALRESLDRFIKYWE